MRILDVIPSGLMNQGSNTEMDGRQVKSASFPGPTPREEEVPAAPEAILSDWMTH